MSMELFAAVLAADHAAIAELLAAGADPNTRKASLWTSHMKLITENPKFAPHLLRNEYTDPNPLIIWTWTPLLLACAQKNWDIATMLLEAGAEADVFDEQNQTPLMFAVRGAQPTLVHRLLTGGADPNRTTEEGFTPLMAAAMLDNSDHPLAMIRLASLQPFVAPVPAEQQDAFRKILQALLAHGADVNAVEEKGATALIYAATRGWTEGVRLLLDAGADMNCEAELMGTPLIACLPTYPETARFLLERGANLAALSRYGEGALTRAIGHRTGDAERLRSKDAEPTDKKNTFLGIDMRNASTLDEYRSQPEDLTALTLLLDAGADPNQLNPSEFATPLITAARRDAVASILLLLARGADINGLDNQGNSPLMIAARHSCIHAVQALLEAGADYTLRNQKGNTALMAASLPGNPERMLQKLNSMSPPTLDTETEERLQKLQTMKERLGERGEKIVDVDKLRSMPTDFRAGMRAFLERGSSEHAVNREKVIQILKEAGATE